MRYRKENAMEERLIGKVHNGNYDIMIYSDGTKVRRNSLDCFIPDKPESLDYKITNMCDRGCPFCHEGSVPNGLHGDIMNDRFVETLNPYTEIAIGGGNPLEHPDLIPFLEKCRRLHLIPNMTVNQVHFQSRQKMIRELVDRKLIYGLGISLVSPTDEFISLARQYPNAVIHMINGVHTMEDFRRLYDHGLKILILGYKDFRRGESFHSPEVDARKERTYVFLPEILEHFRVVSFDNLALSQLDVRSLLTPDEWDRFYMGGDGTFTMFVDSVSRTFSTSSTTPIGERQPMMDDIKPMFDYVRGHHNG